MPATPPCVRQPDFPPMTNVRTMTQASPGDFPRVGVSACVLGHAVRFDGGHKRDAFVVDELATCMELVPYCPETAIGLPVPRPPIRLVGEDPARPRAVGVRDPSLDVTERLEAYAATVADGLGEYDGFVLKKDSPSCGMERVRLYHEGGGAATRNTSGVFARVLRERLPNLPMEEEGRLNDPVLRENFVTRVFVHRRWRALTAEPVRARALIDFHTRHKYLVMAHSAAAYQRLGRMLSDLSRERAGATAPAYFTELMQALARRANRKRHYNVLQHIMGYLKTRIDAADKVELADAIERYRREEVPLVVPITLFRHYFRVHPDPYIEQQVYLAPHPDSLRLRNHV